jgi:hypothetical protein
MVNVGLAVLWIVDQMVYQRLFNTNYIAGLRLEQQFAVIPPVRAIQRISAGEMSIASWVKFFYTGPILAFAVTAVVAAISLVSASMADRTVELVLVVVALLCLVPLAYVTYYARKVDFRRFVTVIPGDYSSILDSDNCRAIVLRHIDRLVADKTARERESCG